MTTSRTFIAIELSSEALDALADLQNRLKTIVPPQTICWTALQNIHLTLHFLGDIAVGDAEEVSEAIDATTLTYKPFSLTLGKLGCFPNTRRPRIVWVGILGETSSLTALHQDLGNKIRAAINFAPDTRPYSPHLTIGRVRKGIPSRHMAQLSQVLQQEQPKVGQLADMRVTEISLMKSELKPAGAVYTQISRGELKNDPQNV